MTELYRTLSEYINEGGFVMPPLVAATLVLWYLLGYRAATLRRGSLQSLHRLLDRCRRHAVRAPRGIVERAAVLGVTLVRRFGDRLDRHGLRQALDDAFGPSERELSRGRIAVRSLVAAAPLAGLLGTVTGMIETFDSLAEMALFTQSGGIAGGISQALLTTQMGLSIAVPGLIVGRFLDKRQDDLGRELEQLKDLLCEERFGPVVASGVAAMTPPRQALWHRVVAIVRRPR